MSNSRNFEEKVTLYSDGEAVCDSQNESLSSIIKETFDILFKIENGLDHAAETLFTGKSSPQNEIEKPNSLIEFSHENRRTAITILRKLENFNSGLE